MNPGPVEPIKIPPEPKDLVLQERRLSMRMMALWQDLRSGRPCPLASRFDPEKISDLWPDCFMVKPAAEWTKSPFLHIGERLAAQAKLTKTDIELGEVPPSTLLATSLKVAGDVLRVRHPLLESGEFTSPDGEKLLFRSIVLPLEGPDGNIEALVGGARQRIEMSAN